MKSPFIILPSSETLRNPSIRRLSIRITEYDYQVIDRLAVKAEITPNMLIANMVADGVKHYIKERKN